MECTSSPYTHVPWNKGELVGQKAPLKPKEVWAIRARLQMQNYGTHSIRRTKASLVYRRTKNLRSVQLLLGQSKLESTVRYLGIEVDDALELVEQTDV